MPKEGDEPGIGSMIRRSASADDAVGDAEAAQLVGQVQDPADA